MFCQIGASPAESTNFYTIWRMNSDFYLYLPTFSNTLFNRLFISFSISFKYYFYIYYLFFFLTTTHFPTFFYSTPNYYNRKKDLKNEQLLAKKDLMSYCSLGKKKEFQRVCWSTLLVVFPVSLSIFWLSIAWWRCSYTMASNNYFLFLSVLDKILCFCF